MKYRNIVIALIAASSPAFAEKAPDYNARVDGWKIEGRFFGDGYSCGASVTTKAGIVQIDRFHLNDKWQTTLSVKGGVGVIKDDVADAILKSPELLQGNKKFAHTGGSENVLQEFNRCLEAGMMRDGGD